MSWIAITALILVVSFACAYGLCEWVTRRRRADGEDGSALR